MPERGATPETSPEPEARPEPDSLLGGLVRLYQPLAGYRAAIDPVLLAAALTPRPGERVLDVGSGTGAALLCLAARCPQADVTGLEMEPTHAALARRSIALNGLESRCRMILGDLGAPPPGLAAPFDAVITNPPYMPGGSPPPDAAKAGAVIESLPLSAWLAFSLRLLKPKGRLVMVHRADRLDALLGGLAGRAGEVVVLPLHPRPGRPASRVLVRARKGVRGPAVLLPGLILHEQDSHRYAPAVEAVLRHAAALDLEPPGRG